MCCKIYVHYWENCEYKGTKSCKTYKVKKNTYGDFNTFATKEIFAKLIVRFLLLKKDLNIQLTKVVIIVSLYLV